MAPLRARMGNCSLAILSFFIILISILCVDSICHAFLHVEANPFAGNHLAVETAAALLASLFIAALLIRTRQLSTELRSMEVSRAREDWEKAFNTMTDFVSVHDKDMKIIKVNKALSDFLGKEPEDILGRLCYQLFHNMDEPFQNCPHLKAAELNHAVSEVISDANIGVPLQITCSPLFDDGGRFQGTVHIARVVEQNGIRRRKGDRIIPICASCKSIRTGAERWISPEEYFVKNCGAHFSHTICKACQEKIYPELVQL